MGIKIELIEIIVKTPISVSIKKPAAARQPIA